LVNVPIGAVVALLAARRLPEPPERGAAPLDPIGAVGIAAALGLVLVPLTLGRTEGWPLWTWVSIAAAAPAALAALGWERSVRRRGGTPVLELSLLRSTSFVLGLTAGATYMFSFASLMFTLTLLLQGGLGLDPLQAGLVFSPMGVIFSVVALYGRGRAGRHGFLVVLAGGLLAAVGLAVLVAALAAGGDDTSVLWLMVGLSVTGAGCGLVHPTLMGITLATVGHGQAGAASGMVVTAQQFAGSVGVGALGAVFYGVLDNHHGPDPYATAMQWAGGLCLVAMLVVSALAVLMQRMTAAAATEDVHATA
jgi:hypothetical protein